MPPGDFLGLMVAGYLVTAAVETAVLLVGLSARHPVRVRLFAGVWLSACTIPVVWLVLPPLFAERWTYLLVAETFAPLAECVLFWWAFARPLAPDRRATARDLAAITVANLLSFSAGEVAWAMIG